MWSAEGARAIFETPTNSILSSFVRRGHKNRYLSIKKKQTSGNCNMLLSFPQDGTVELAAITYKVKRRSRKKKEKNRREKVKEKIISSLYFYFQWENYVIKKIVILISGSEILI